MREFEVILREITARAKAGPPVAGQGDDQATMDKVDAEIARADRDWLLEAIGELLEGTAADPISSMSAEPVVDLPEAPYPAAAQAARLCAQLHALLEQVREAERETVAVPLRRALGPSCAGLPARDCGLVAEAALRDRRERVGEVPDAGQAGYSSVLEEVARIIAEPHTGLARSLAERLRRALSGDSPPDTRRTRTQEAELRELIEAVRAARHARGTYATHGLTTAVDALLAAVPAPPPSADAGRAPPDDRSR